MFSLQIILRVKRTCFNSSFIRSKHIYKSPPLTLSQLENSLIESAVYEKGLLIVNKPIGISFERGLIDADSLNPGKDVCLKSALVKIKDHFNIKELYNCKIPERNISGVTIFAESKELSDELRKWWKVFRDNREEADTYHAIVVGTPKRNHGHFEGTISLQNQNGIKRMVLSEEIRKNAVKRGEDKRVTFTYKTICSNNEASLLEISASRTKWNSVRAFLATQTLTPVLGDELYGMYVTQLLGAPVPIDVFSKSLLGKKKLSQNLCNQLNISNRKYITVPLHLHLSSVRLKMRIRGEVLEYSMPYSEIFKWTLEQLGFSSEQSEVSASL